MVEHNLLLKQFNPIHNTGWIPKLYSITLPTGWFHTPMFNPNLYPISLNGLSVYVPKTHMVV